MNYVDKTVYHCFSSLFNQNRDGPIVRGGLTPPFSTNHYEKRPKLSEMI